MLPRLREQARTLPHARPPSQEQQQPDRQVHMHALQAPHLQALQAAVAAAVVHGNADGARQLGGDARLLRATAKGAPGLRGEPWLGIG